MSEKQAKKLRKQLKEVNGFDIKAKADYRVSHKVKKMAYFTSKDQHGIINTKAVPVERVVIVNAAKHGYRRLKKEMSRRS